MLRYYTPENTRSKIEARLLKFRRIDPVTGCWLWTGLFWDYGYGKLAVRRKAYRTHRLAMYVWRGFDLERDRRYICHRCDVPACFNPDHLFVGTPLDNMRDMVAKGRHRRVATYGNARLSADDVRAIRAEIAAGMTQMAIAAKWGVQQTTISDIKLRKSWKHIE